MARKYPPPLPEELRHRVKTLLWARPLILTFVLGVGLVVLRREGSLLSPVPLYALLAITYVLSLAYLLVFRSHLPLKFFLYLQMTMDIAVETALIHFSGGLDSQFSLLYFLSIVTGSVFLLLPGGIYLASLSSLAYGFVLWFDFQARALGGQVEPFSTESRSILANLVVARVFLHAVLFYFVAFLAGYLAELAQAKGRELERAQLDTSDILRNLGSGLVTLDARGEIIYFNRMAEEILGMPEKETRGRLAREAFPARLRSFGSHLMKALEEGSSRRREEMTIVDSKGRNIPLGISVTPLWDDEGEKRGAIVIFQDLTEAKRMEERLRRADRLAAVGELSAGIAHEIRNPLASIRGSAEMLREEEDLSPENRRLMQLIVKEADRLNRIVEDFLLYARRRPPQFDLVRLDLLVEEVAELVGRHDLDTSETQLLIDRSAGPLLVEADEAQMRQVLLNLLVNSLEAVNGRGHVRVRWDPSASGNAGRVSLTVEDDGTGIQPAEMERIFEPFYTTKQSGSGLGLSIVHWIVQGHGGEVIVESDPGKSTRFTVWLPRRQPRVIPPEAAQA